MLMSKAKKRLAWWNSYPRQYPHANDYTVRQKYYQIFRILRALKDGEALNRGYCGWHKYQGPGLICLITDNDTDTVYWLARESLEVREHKSFTGWVNYERWLKYMDLKGWIPF